MNNLKDILKKYQIHPREYEIKGKVIIVKTQNNQYVIKNNTNNYDIYHYLNTRNFNYFPSNYNLHSEKYDISEYIEDINIPNNQRLNDLIYLLSLLHKQTSFYKIIDLDEIKEKYEDLNRNVLDLLNYYNNLNDYLDSLIFPSPAQFLLLKNISIIYYLLNYVKNTLAIWYQEITTKKEKRVALIHNNISIEHVLVNKGKYLISWDKSLIDEPIKDLISLYKKYYNFLNLKDLLNTYNKNNLLNREEVLLFIIMLALPEKITFTKDHLKDVKMLNRELNYWKKIYEYLKNNQGET